MHSFGFRAYFNVKLLPVGSTGCAASDPRNVQTVMPLSADRDIRLSYQ